MRAGLYGRVSGDEQREKQTILTQIEFLRAYCKLHDIEIIEEYGDEGVSGTVPLDDRPAAARMLRDAERGRFELVIVYKLDRLARSVALIYDAVSRLETQEIQFRSCTESFDTTTPMGRMLMGLLAVFAAWERELIRERSYEGRLRAARDGRWPSGTPALGYRVEEGRLVKDELPIPEYPRFSEAELARLIWRAHLSDELSMHQIARDMNAVRVPTPVGCNIPRRQKVPRADLYWRHSTVRAIITNPIYKGEAHFGPVVYSVPAFVSDEEWERGQERLIANRNQSPRNSKRFYLLSGMMRCGICGARYVGVPRLPRSRSYICAARQNPDDYAGPGGKACPAPRLIADEIEDAVWQQLLRFASAPDEVLELLAAGMEDRRHNRETLCAEADRLAAAVVRCKDARHRAQLLFTRGQATDEQVADLLKEIKAEQTALEEQQQEMLAELTALADPDAEQETATALLSRLRAFLEGQDHTPQERRQILRRAVRQIVVHPDKSLDATYVFGSPDAIAVGVSPRPHHNWRGLTVLLPVWKKG